MRGTVKRIKDNVVFEWDDTTFCKSLEKATDYIGEPQIEKFIEFWEGIWEIKHEIPEWAGVKKV